MKTRISLALLTALSALNSTAHAALINFDIQTSSTAIQYQLDNGGNVSSNVIEVESIGFSDSFRIAGLMELWSDGPRSVDYGNSLYTYSTSVFGPLQILGTGAYTNSSLAQNTLTLPLSSDTNIYGFTNFTDYYNPGTSDWGNNSVNLMINYFGSSTQYQSDVAYIQDWFQYSRQYIIYFDAPDSADEVFTHSSESVLALIQSEQALGVNYHESWFRGSSSCIVNESCTSLSFDGVQYIGFGAYNYDAEVSVDSPAALPLLACGSLLLLSRRRKRAASVSR